LIGKPSFFLLTFLLFPILFKTIGKPSFPRIKTNKQNLANFLVQLANHLGLALNPNLVEKVLSPLDFAPSCTVEMCPFNLCLSKIQVDWQAIIFLTYFLIFLTFPHTFQVDWQAIIS
jgi:hypothetical protein